MAWKMTRQTFYVRKAALKAGRTECLPPESQGQYDCKEKPKGKLGMTAIAHVPRLQRAFQIFASDILQKFRPGAKVSAAY